MFNNTSGIANTKKSKSKRRSNTELQIQKMETQVILYHVHKSPRLRPFDPKSINHQS